MDRRPSDPEPVPPLTATQSRFAKRSPLQGHRRKYLVPKTAFGVFGTARLDLPIEKCARRRFYKIFD
jgi:hypothetical protein